MSVSNLELQPHKGEKLVFDTNSVLTEQLTHYCPGCHHGIAHRLITQAIHDMDIAAETILVPSVGCSAFIYNYMNLDCIEAPHGRASAVATGVKRARPDKIVFAYQGDGDLGSIGIAEGIHAANRGENITVFFVNNTVFGMTGGQMAPTTLLGQKTTTSPAGRSMSSDGAPIRLAEIMAQLDGVVFSTRCALNSIKNIKKAQKAIRKAFEIQKQNLGYTFIELLCGCPTNWHMDAIKANEHIGNSMIPVFPLGVFKDSSGMDNSSKNKDIAQDNEHE